MPLTLRCRWSGQIQNPGLLAHLPWFRVELVYAVGVPRRRAGVLLPLEEEILELGLERARLGDPEFYGFAVAEALGDAGGGRLLGHGTLYKALSRLENAGLLASKWEEVDPVAAGRPRRRLYWVSPGAAGALSTSRASRSPDVARVVPA